MYRKEQKGGNPPFALLELFNDKGLELLVKLLSSGFSVVSQLNGLAKVEAENTEDGLAVYLVLAGFEIYVSIKSNENVNELINVIDLSELNVKCHGYIPFQVYLSGRTLYIVII